VRRILDLDPQTDARIETLAARMGQDAAAVVADAVELLDSVIDIDGPDVEEDVRRLREFEQTGERGPCRRGQGLSLGARPASFHDRSRAKSMILFSSEAVSDIERVRKFLNIRNPSGMWQPTFLLGI
jgi:hypothetical protein